jgi:Tol biopolymer transport system component
MKRLLAPSLAVIVAAMLGLPAFASDDRIGVITLKPSPSPVGSEVAFGADFDSPASQLHLWISGLDGSNLRRVTTPPTATVDEEPAWSPDGTTIAFSSYNGVTSDIWTVASPSLALTQLTTKSLNNREAAWSPDGKRIAFVSDRGGTNDIWIMNADGSGQTRLTKLPGQENHPSFSPDGASIVFSETVNGAANLMIVNADGSNLRSLTAGAFDDWHPAWGPGGIAFSSNRDPAAANNKIWIVQPDGTGLQKVSDAIGYHPAWTKSGTLLFTDTIPGTRALSAVSQLDPATGKKTLVTTADGYSVGIDIRPGKSPKYIHPSGEGRVAVAILSTPTFDAVASVDQTTLTFGETGAEQSQRRCRSKGIDVNGDGLPDLLCRFSLQAAGFRRGDTVAILKFLSKDATPYEGRQAIITTDTDDGDDFGDD